MIKPMMKANSVGSTKIGQYLRMAFSKTDPPFHLITSRDPYSMYRRFL